MKKHERTHIRKQDTFEEETVGNTVNTVVALRHRSGKPLEDVKVIVILLESLPGSYSTLAGTRRTIEYIIRKIMDECQRRKESQS